MSRDNCIRCDKHNDVGVYADDGGGECDLPKWIDKGCSVGAEAAGLRRRTAFRPGAFASGFKQRIRLTNAVTTTPLKLPSKMPMAVATALESATSDKSITSMDPLSYSSSTLDNDDDGNGSNFDNDGNESNDGDSNSSSNNSSRGTESTIKFAHASMMITSSLEHSTRNLRLLLQIRLYTTFGFIVTLLLYHGLIYIWPNHPLVLLASFAPTSDSPKPPPTSSTSAHFVNAFLPSVSRRTISVSTRRRNLLALAHYTKVTQPVRGLSSSSSLLYSTTQSPAELENMFSDQESVVDDSLTSSDSLSFRAPVEEINRRRNLAIISHPDSGKTTMTEKLLLYGGAVQVAGAVRTRGTEQRSTTSDFMEMERQRGISISSTVLNFEYTPTTSIVSSITTTEPSTTLVIIPDDIKQNHLQPQYPFGIRLIDTPGHNDFSEDTYRALAAADNALMLLDGAKGLEPQTRKLFEVCRMRTNPPLPLFTFVNKMDRPALSPYEIMDQLEQEFQLETYPILWPIGDGDRFKGVLDRTTNIVHLFNKAEVRGGKARTQATIKLNRDGNDTNDSNDTLRQLLNDDELFYKLLDDAETLDELISPLDINRVLAGEQSPLFFGSAMTNFGIELFLNKFCAMGTKPVGRQRQEHQPKKAKSYTLHSVIELEKGNEENMASMIYPHHDEFTGFVFKTQANLDPKHRDRLAYVRIISGMYRKGMKVGHSRSKPNKRYTLTQAQLLFGNERTSIDVAYPGDVIGINNPTGGFAIGDTLYTGTEPVSFPGMPSFSPETFVYIRNPNPSEYKSYAKGIEQLLAEGAVQALRQRGSGTNGRNSNNDGPLLLAAVGQLQFDVVKARLKNEYNVDCIMDPPISYTIARWVGIDEDQYPNGGGVEAAWAAVDKADKNGKLFGTMIVQDRWGRPVILFRSDWKALAVEKEEKYLNLRPWSYPPREQ